jgi:hypothetical protein
MPDECEQTLLPSERQTIKRHVLRWRRGARFSRVFAGRAGNGVAHRKTVSPDRAVRIFEWNSRVVIEGALCMTDCV